MNRKQFVLYEPGGRVARGFAYGKLVEVRYIDVVRTGIESADRDEFIQLVEQAQLSEEELRECRIGYVDDKGVGTYHGWQEFLDMALESS
ncbi:MAG: hypothetical protein OXI34_05660 [Chloroflexota bacterium]|nr:hypothetical protein [Chloroflexota bacterium]MDE2852660.1 hypothetical protein [Chloroflexota bacterium]MDE2946122.1 hypothetical protein [Chloroflexota bacterium]